MPPLAYPATTALTAAALGLLQVGLTLFVIHGRAKFRTGLGGEDNEPLRRRIRMHGNLTENAPIVLILLLLNELGGAAGLVRVVGPLFVLLRLSHAYGLSPRFGPGPNPFRFTGAAGTGIVAVILAVRLLLRAV